VPDPERIRYVGQLQSSTDLKPTPKPFQAIANWVVGQESPERLYGPRSVVCTEDGNRVWVADPGGRCVHLFDLASRSHKKISRIDGKPLLSPVGLCLGPEDSVYVCDSEDVAIHRLSASSGALLETLRIPEELRRPVAAIYDHGAGELFVVDSVSHRIVVLDAGGRLVRIIGRRGAGAGEFNFPCAIADDGRLIWVVDAGNQRVQSLTRTGEPVATIGRVGDAPGELALPKGIALDEDGHIYVVDGRFENVQIFDANGRLLLSFGEEGTGPGEFWLPSGIFIDRQRRIWICDSYNGRLQVFEYVRILEIEEHSS
jgi:DNA-binding beta-propeller fold protein YncE